MGALPACSCLACGDPASGSMGSIVGLVENSKRVYAKGDLPVPPSLGQLLSTHTSTGGPPTLGGSFGSVSCEIFASLLWVLVHAKFCLCPPRLESLFTQSSGRYIIKACWPSRPDSLRILSPFVGSLGWEDWCGVQNLHNSERTSLVLLFFSLWVTHPAGMGFDFIMIAPLLSSRCDFFFVFGGVVPFFGGFQCPPVSGYSTASCNFGALTGDEHKSFYSTILKCKPLNISTCAFRLSVYPPLPLSLPGENHLHVPFPPA